TWTESTVPTTAAIAAMMSATMAAVSHPDSTNAVTMCATAATPTAHTVAMTHHLSLDMVTFCQQLVSCGIRKCHFFLRERLSVAQILGRVAPPPGAAAHVTDRCRRPLFPPSGPGRSGSSRKLARSAVASRAQTCRVVVVVFGTDVVNELR